MPETISPLSSVSDTYSHTRLLNNIEQLFAQARPRLLHLAHLNGVVSDYTEDVVQETLVEAWRHLETLREPARFHAWLDGICRNICRRQKRKDDTLSLHEQRIGSLFDPDATGEMDAWLDLSTSDPLEDLSQQDLATLLDRAMGHLPAHTRQMLEMCYLAEIPQREVAQCLELTIGALELRLHRARQQLRQILNGPLRPEAQYFGVVLDPEEAQNWQVMRPSGAGSVANKSCSLVLKYRLMVKKIYACAVQHAAVAMVRHSCIHRE
jgi:RNA polymerase sigma-70 factor (ECF subfamily)